MHKNVNIPNALTMSRVIFLPVLYVFVLLDMRLAFLIAFMLIGATDAFDGFVARRLNQVTEFGKAMDSIADLLLYISTAWFLYRLYPQYILPNMNLLIAFFSLLGVSFIVSFIRCGKPIMMHTSILRYQAVLIYLLVIFSYFLDTTYFVTAILIIYLIGFTEEILIFLRYGQVDADTKSIICLLREEKELPE